MQVKIKQISGLQDIINSPVSMGIEYSQSFNILVSSTGNDFQTGVTMDYTPFADSVIQVQVNGLTVEGSYTDKLGGFYFSNDGVTVKSMVNLESGDFLYWNGLIKGYQLEVGDIVTILYEKEYLSYGTSGISGNGSGNGNSGTSGIDGINGSAGTSGISTDGTSGTSGVSALWNFMETYNGNAEYHVGDVVTYEGQTWYALVPNQYMPPDMINRPNDWKLITEKGSSGTSGLQGPAGETLSVSGVVENYNTLISIYGSIIGEFQPVLLTTVILKNTSELYIYDNVSGSADLNGWVNMGVIQGPQGLAGVDGTSGLTGNNGSAGTSGLTGNNGSAGTSGVTGNNGSSGSAGSSGSSGINGRRDITHVGVSAGSAIIFIADNKIFCAKGNDAATAAYQQALYPGANGNTGLQRGINQMYEIPVLGESGTLVKADFYGFSAYALYDNGNLYTWGYNGYGNLGNGGTTVVDYPTLVQTGVSDVYTHTSNMTSDPEYNRLIIKKTDGKIYGTGYNGYYQFGLGNTTNRTSFTELPWAGTNPLSVWNIGTYSGMIIVQKSDGTIVMSGMNEYGRLGIGNYTTPTTATSAASAAWLNNDTTYRIKWVYGGERFYNGNWNSSNGISMLLDNGTQTRIVGAGVNSWGIIGDNTTTQRNVPTVPTGTWTSVKQMVGKGAIVSSIWALKNDGTLWNWGRNAESQLGRGNTTDAPLPSQVMTGVAKLWEGSQSLLYFSYYQASPIIEKTDGTYWCCGYNDYFGLGTGQTTGYYSSFYQMRFPADFRMKKFGQTAYNNNTAINYAVSTTNDIYCWGYNGGNHIDPNDSSAIAVPLKFSPNALIK